MLHCSLLCKLQNTKQLHYRKIFFEAFHEQIRRVIHNEHLSEPTHIAILNLIMEILSPKQRSSGRQFFDPFLGQNEENEIETYDEFLDKVSAKDPATIDMTGWNFQAVDFSLMDPEVWKKYNFKGASFWGCTFPKGKKKSQ